MPYPATTAPRLDHVIARHARAIIDRTPAPSGTVVKHADAECHEDAQAILAALSEYDRWLSMQASRIATRAAEAAAREIEDAFYGDANGLDVDHRKVGIAAVLDELEKVGATDEVAGVSPADDVARRFRREILR